MLPPLRRFTRDSRRLGSDREGAGSTGLKEADFSSKREHWAGHHLTSAAQLLAPVSTNEGKPESHWLNSVPYALMVFQWPRYSTVAARQGGSVYCGPSFRLVSCPEFCQQTFRNM